MRWIATEKSDVSGRLKLGAGEMIQPIKNLTGLIKDMSLVFRILVQELSWWHLLVISEWRSQGQRDLGDSGQPAWPNGRATGQ